MVKESEEISCKPSQSKSKENSITSASVSNCGKFICACDTNKLLHLWEYENGVWKALSVRSLSRKCQKVIFSNSCSNIILADRGGDVFNYSTLKYNEPGCFLLGHISLILDIAISNNDKYLATCDRDGKIRISCYPNTYNILNYCLGHQEFVSSIQFISLPEEKLLSTSGDGTIRLWQYEKHVSDMNCVTLHENKLLCKECNINYDKETKSEREDRIPENLIESETQILFSVRCVKYCNKYNLFAILFHLQSGIAIYQLNNTDNDFKFKQFISLDAPPLDAVFLDDGQFFILIKHETVALKHFDYNVTEQEFIAVADESTFQIVKDIQLFYEKYQGMLFQDDFVSLFKRVYESNGNNDECHDTQSKKNKTD
ncbi:hypothetical protein NPIL_602751 [Nephila pilipes]|uniref:tRNA (guanine-N(7)-)-methyltransferase non-catalytic subunit n=1 Tax=Nephila pilipes TaxID=299642 RepID=A0A8X6P1I4_NEPPI|nr:hypothetical protein NPIL_602751 [Nephila pilipes]